ncbi:unnamed protein product, partial [Mesorhabditis spiculigera]
MSVQPSQMSIEEGRKHPTRSATASAIGNMGPEAGAGILVGGVVATVLTCFTATLCLCCFLGVKELRKNPKSGEGWLLICLGIPVNVALGWLIWMWVSARHAADPDAASQALQQSYPAETTTLFRNDTLLSGYLGSNASGPTGYRTPGK